MSSKALALTAIGTQLILGLILVAILFSIQNQPLPEAAPVGPIHVVVDPAPTCTPTWWGPCGLRNGGD
jgi:hypothetical protein